jgi:chromosome segregation ATPase
MVFAKRVAAPTAVVIPTLEEASPEYANLVSKRGELEARRAEIDREVDKLRKGTAPAALAAARTDRALALLGDVADTATRLVPTQADIARRVADLNRERGDIEGALAMLATRIEQATNKASRAVCDRIRDGYAAAIVDVALALTKAMAAHGELIRIQEELEHNEVRWLGSLPQPASLNMLLGNRYRDVNQSAAERFIADAISAGIVTPHELEKTNG